MSTGGLGKTSSERLESFRNYNIPKKRTKPKSPKKRLPPKATKGFK